MAQLERFTLYQVIHARKVLITLGGKTSLGMYKNKNFNFCILKILHNCNLKLGKHTPTMVLANHGVCTFESLDLFSSEDGRFSESDCRISSIILTTSSMVGLKSGTFATQDMAICNICTISSSMFWYLINSTSKTSAVHSSLTTDWTHLGRSTKSSRPGDWRGAFPVSISRRRTPKLYTSDL